MCRRRNAKGLVIHLTPNSSVVGMFSAPNLILTFPMGPQERTALDFETLLHALIIFTRPYGSVALPAVTHGCEGPAFLCDMLQYFGHWVI